LYSMSEGEGGGVSTHGVGTLEARKDYERLESKWGMLRVLSWIWKPLENVWAVHTMSGYKDERERTSLGSIGKTCCHGVNGKVTGARGEFWANGMGCPRSDGPQPQESVQKVSSLCVWVAGRVVQPAESFS